jgi:ketosteroid isomerase-like protein
VDRAGVERWIEAYRQAWKTDDPEDIAALFTEDATYSPFPWPREKNRWEGRDTIVQRWIGHGDSKLSWRFEHDVLAVDGDAAVVEGWTDYDDEAFANVWLIRFADDGRAREFREWWVQKPAGD